MCVCGGGGDFWSRSFCWSSVNSMAVNHCEFLERSVAMSVLVAFTDATDSQ